MYIEYFCKYTTKNAPEVLTKVITYILWHPTYLLQEEFSDSEIFFEMGDDQIELFSKYL